MRYLCLFLVLCGWCAGATWMQDVINRVFG